jgi:hypothetical protein
MMFYNGFNLLIDIILCSIAGYFAYRFGFAEGFRKSEEDNSPPF